MTVKEAARQVWMEHAEKGDQLGRIRLAQLLSIEWGDKVKENSLDAWIKIWKEEIKRLPAKIPPKTDTPQVIVDQYLKEMKIIDRITGEIETLHKELEENPEPSKYQLVREKRGWFRDLAKSADNKIRAMIGLKLLEIKQDETDKKVEIVHIVKEA